jgi:hypothetical protein
MTADRYHDDAYDADPYGYGGEQAYGPGATGTYPGDPYRPPGSPPALPGGGRAARHRRDRRPRALPARERPPGGPPATRPDRDPGGHGWAPSPPAPPQEPPVTGGAWGGPWEQPRGPQEPWEAPPPEAPVSWQAPQPGGWPTPQPQPRPARAPRYFGEPPPVPGAHGTGGWSGQAVAAPAAWPELPGRAAPPAMPGRVTPSRASRHSRRAAADRSQVWRKRAVIAGAYLVAMVLCWFYVFPWLENVLPAEF